MQFKLYFDTDIPLIYRSVSYFLYLLICTPRMPRLIWVFAGRTLILLVLSCLGSYLKLLPYVSCWFHAIRMSDHFKPNTSFYWKTFKYSICMDVLTRTLYFMKYLTLNNTRQLRLDYDLVLLVCKPNHLLVSKDPNQTISWSVRTLTKPSPGQ